MHIVSTSRKMYPRKKGIRVYPELVEADQRFAG
jgi:hypothetical protein